MSSRRRSPRASSSARCAAAASCSASTTWTRATASRSSTRSFGVARRIDDEALERGLLVYSTQPTADGYAGDQTLLAPAFVSTDAELAEMVARMAAVVVAVERRVKDEIAAAAGAR